MPLFSLAPDMSNFVNRSTTSTGLHQVRSELRMLEANLAKALMINEALWELLRDKTGLTEQDLYDKLYEIDMRDGKLDGKNQPAVRKCPNCHRPVSSRHSTCIYCGQVIDDSVFRMT